MGVIQLINNIVMVILIGFFILSGSVLITRTISEERKKSAVIGFRLMDKYLDKLEERITRIIDQNKKERTTYQQFSRPKMVKPKECECKEEFDDLDYMDDIDIDLKS